MAIDYGTKRTGLAVTDPLKIIATGLDTVATSTVIDYIGNDLLNESVEAIIIGMPKHLNNTDAAIVPDIRRFIAKLKIRFPDMVIYETDERFTSRMAQRSMPGKRAEQKNKKKQSIN